MKAECWHHIPILWRCCYGAVKRHRYFKLYADVFPKSELKQQIDVEIKCIGLIANPLAFPHFLNSSSRGWSWSGGSGSGACASSVSHFVLRFFYFVCSLVRFRCLQLFGVDCVASWKPCKLLLRQITSDYKNMTEQKWVCTGMYFSCVLCMKRLLRMLVNAGLLMIWLWGDYKYLTIVIILTKIKNIWRKST